jgi:hypothetical protein
MAQVHYVEGSVVDGFCPKCEAVTEHTIIKATKRSLREVKCEVCSFVHKYQKTAKAKTKAKKAKTKAKKAKTKRKTRKKAQEVDRKAQAMAEWEAACLENAGVEPLDYSMKTAWEPGAVLLHSSFGKGVVLKTLSERKIEVIFQDGRKRLVQNLKK